IGTNHGSLSDRILNRYGDTPLGMVESALEFARIARDLDYHAFVFSMKASNPKIMIAAYRLLVARLNELGPDWNYPVHLGVTEAGEGEDARIKSAIGIGSLLADGIGDTIRVSLTEDSPHEIPVAKALVNLTSRRAAETASTTEDVDRSVVTAFRLLAARLQPRHPILLKDEGRRMKDESRDFLQALLIASTNIGSLLCDGIGDAVLVQGEEAPGQALRLSYNILQAAGSRIFKTDYVACPSCGRTLFNLQTTTAKIKEATSHLKGVKIAIMGCIVNGPGEMADA